MHFSAARRGTGGWSLDDAYVERAQWEKKKNATHPGNRRLHEDRQMI